MVGTCPRARFPTCVKGGVPRETRCARPPTRSTVRALGGGYSLLLVLIKIQYEDLRGRGGGSFFGIYLSNEVQKMESLVKEIEDIEKNLKDQIYGQLRL